MKQINFYNTLTRQVEEFKSIKDSIATIYTCGPTVYDSSHIGHARGMIVWDILVRFLKAAGYTVIWARNLTDIDDKIINRSKELGILPDQLARLETYKFWHDMHSLNITIPDIEPRATENMSEMFEFIEGLMKKGYAYQTESGDIFFRVKAFGKYGQLKNLAAEEENVSRIEHETGKENAADFSLWKAMAESEYGYSSPFGHGRPGWHLECSAMIKKHFGETIDIHGGGEDLVFPHHENEIAQSEALHSHEGECQKFVNYWMHNGMIMVNGQKMSKSLGNYITIQDALNQYCGNSIRMFVLGTHYRQNLNYTDEGMEAAKAGFEKIYNAIEKYNLENVWANEEIIDEFLTELADDMNTAKAIALIHQTVKALNQSEDPILASTIYKMMEILGFEMKVNKPENSINLNQFEGIFQFLLTQRDKARSEKDFALADQIRDLFTNAGLEVRDGADGTKVEQSSC